MLGVYIDESTNFENLVTQVFIGEMDNISAVDSMEDRYMLTE